jgi:hypothetical protein
VLAAQVQKKQAAAKEANKKVVIKDGTKARGPVADQDEFERVDDRI